MKNIYMCIYIYIYIWRHKNKVCYDAFTIKTFCFSFGKLVCGQCLEGKWFIVSTLLLSFNFS